ncbi:hypothetical protein ColKHC_09151 [Colletotrichum higginsianum]|nr:hypothetical protein ColKHC_09151 [Colletotrichum higginsianum]
MKLSALLPVFLLNGIASASIAQMLCNNKPPLSQWGPANCSEKDHWDCYARCQKECDCYCWV